MGFFGFTFENAFTLAARFESDDHNKKIGRIAEYSDATGTSTRIRVIMVQVDAFEENSAFIE